MAKNPNQLCVFCGERPQSKTKEHIIPRWLIEKTGDPKRLARFAYNFSTDRPVEFAFDQFTFPACQACNEQFSDLESYAKRVLTKLEDLAPLSEIDITFFLDWLDKIRIGLWHGHLRLTGDRYKVQPRMFIQPRLGMHDRMVAIYRTPIADQRINFVGHDSILFQHIPSCFLLIINNLYFFNVSRDFVFARRVGFPYPAQLRSKGWGGPVEYYLAEGIHRIMKPILKTPIVRPCLEFYQPNAFARFVNDNSVLYSRPYVVEHCLDWRGTESNVFVGKILVSRPDGQITVLDGEYTPEHPMLIHSNDYSLRIALAEQTLKHQTSMFREVLDYEYDDKAVRHKMMKIYHYGKRMNDIIIQKLRTGAV